MGEMDKSPNSLQRGSGGWSGFSLVPILMAGVLSAGLGHKIIPHIKKIFPFETKQTETKQIEGKAKCSDLKPLTDRLKMNEYKSPLDCLKDAKELERYVNALKDREIELDCYPFEEIKNLVVSKLCN